MAVFIALGRTLGDDTVPIIFSFLEDSSVVTTCRSDARDVADLNDAGLNISDICMRQCNNCLSNILLDVNASQVCWNIYG